MPPAKDSRIGPPSTGSTSRPSSSSTILQRLTLRNVPRQAPDGRRLGRAINLTFLAGHPAALVGASGTGKTTLLKQIAGWLGADNPASLLAMAQ